MNLVEPERWNNADGDPEADAVELVVLPNEAIAAAVQERLSDADMPHRMLPAHDVLPSFGARMGTPVRVMVRADDVQRAGELISEAMNAGRDIDWDEIDVGEAEDAIARRISQRDAPDHQTDWDESVDTLKAKAMRRHGIMLLAVGAGFVFAFLGFEWVLFAVLAVCAVWLGRAHAIARQRKRVERSMGREWNDG